jgi:hypothetical protein
MANLVFELNLPGEHELFDLERKGHWRGEDMVFIHALNLTHGV